MCARSFVGPSRRCYLGIDHLGSNVVDVRAHARTLLFSFSVSIFSIVPTNNQKKKIPPISLLIRVMSVVSYITHPSSWYKPIVSTLMRCIWSMNSSLYGEKWPSCTELSRDFPSLSLPLYGLIFIACTIFFIVKNSLILISVLWTITSFFKKKLFGSVKAHSETTGIIKAVSFACYRCQCYRR